METAPARRTLVVYDWDDTLYPTTAVYRNASLLSDSARMSVKATLGWLLAASWSAARRIIVTNATAAWVQSCAASLGVDLARAGVDVLSARDASNLWDTRAWKREAYAALARELYTWFSEGPVQVVCVSDSEDDHAAAKEAFGAHANRCLLLKLVHFIESPSVAQLTEQQQLLTTWWGRVLAADSSLNVRLVLGD